MIAKRRDSRYLPGQRTDAYIEMLDSAAFYRECDERFHDQLRDSIDTATNADDDDAEEAPTAEDDVVKYPAWHRAGELVYAAGFLLKVKLAGWKLFCERWSDAPFAAWDERQPKTATRLYDDAGACRGHSRGWCGIERHKDE
jgi:hypothetical protein